MTPPRTPPKIPPMVANVPVPLHVVDVALPVVLDEIVGDGSMVAEFAVVLEDSQEITLISNGAP